MTNKKIDYKELGSGDPVIIFFNGFRMHYQSWSSVYSKMSENNRVILYNRCGVGASHHAKCIQTGEAVVADFQNLLLQLKISDPFIIVAHSLGGVFANLFARMYPEKVVGVIFVDSPHPLEIQLQKKISPPFLLNSINEGIKKVERFFSPYKFSEDEHINETLSQLENSPSFPKIPIAIVSGVKKMPFVPQVAFDLHIEHQKKLLELSTYSKQFLCENSGHFPQISDPLQVISAINYVLGFHKAII